MPLPGSTSPSPAAAEEHASEKKQIRSAIGCLLLFLSPFLIAGTVMLVKGWQDLSSSAGDDAFAMLFVGGVFTGISLYAIFAFLFHGNSYIASIPLRKQFPNQPWMWRVDWARGTVQDKTASRLATAWALALGVTAVLGFFATRVEEILYQFAWDSPWISWAAIALLLVFPLWFLAHAVYRTLQYRKFGRSTLLLAKNPCAVGGRLSGRIETAFAEIPADGARLKLECIQTTRTQSGKNSKTTHKTIWQEEQSLEQFRVGQGPTGIYIPVEFAIPADANPTGKVTANRRYSWKLTVLSSLPGVDYHSEFEPPVFRLNETGRVDDNAPDPT